MKNDSESRIEKEKAQADNVPLGILLPGDTNSPDILAPDIIPVTPEIQCKIMSAGDFDSVSSSEGLYF